MTSVEKGVTSGFFSLAAENPVAAMILIVVGVVILGIFWIKHKKINASSPQWATKSDVEKLESKIDNVREDGKKEHDELKASLQKMRTHNDEEHKELEQKLEKLESKMDKIDSKLDLTNVAVSYIQGHLGNTDYIAKKKKEELK